MKRSAWLPLALGALTALLLILSYPPYNLGWLAWIALVPFFLGIAAADRHVHILALAAGVPWGAALFYPVLFVPGGSALERVGGWLLLVVLIGLFTLFLGWAGAYLRRRRLQPALFLPLVWIALEFGFRRLVVGFAPYLGVTQWQNGWMLALASFTGIHGVSAAVAAVNAAVAELLIVMLGIGAEVPRLRSWAVHAALRPPMYWLPILLGGFTAIAAISQGFLGFPAVRGGERPGGAEGVHRVYLVQPWFTAVEYDAAQSLSDHETFFQRARELTRTALAAGRAEPVVRVGAPPVDGGLVQRARVGGAAAQEAPAGPLTYLVVWPETTLHIPAYEDPGLREQVRSAAREWGAWFLLGLPRQGREGGKELLYNSAFLVSPQGFDAGFYDKVHVIPIAEDQFAAGGGVAAFDVGDQRVSVGICSDAVVPSHARRAVLEGAQALYYLSSLGRIGGLAELQVAFLAFRAAEHRVPVLQASTTGPSVVFGPDGRMVERLAPGEGVLAADVAMGGATGSFYTRSGDLVVVLAGVMMAVSGVIQSRRRLRVW